MSRTKKWTVAIFALFLCICCVFGIRFALDSSAEESAVPETYTIGDFPYHTGYSNFGWYTGKSNVKYKMMAGLFDATAAGYGLQAFDTWDGANKLTLSTLSGLTVENWKWTFAANTSVVIVIESAIDGTIEFDYSSVTLGGWMDTWNTIYTVHRYNAADGSLDTLVNYFHGTDSVSGNAPSSFTASDVYNLTVEVSAGDVIYYEVGSLAERNLQSMTGAQIVATPAVDDLLASLSTQLDAYVASLTRSYYTDESWAQLESYVNAFKSGSYADDAATQTAFNTAKANIDAVACDSVEYYVASYGAQLDALVKTLYEADFKAETWTAIQGRVSDFKNGTYSDEAAVKSAYDAAAAAIRSTQTDADFTQQTYTFINFPGETAQSGYDYWERNNMRYKLMVGLFNASAAGYGLRAFDTYNATDKKLTLSANETLYAQNWKWVFDANTSVVLVMQAKTEGIIQVNMSESSTFGGWNEAYNAVYSVRRYNAADGSLDTLVNYVHGTDEVSGNTSPDSDFTSAGLYDITVEVKQGDVIYYEVGSLQAGRNIQNITSSTVTMIPLNDETAGTVYGEILTEYAESLGEANYTATSWAAINAAVAEFKAGSYETVSAALAAYESAVAAIDAVEPNSLTYFGSQLDALVASLDEENYETESWAEINAAVTAFKAGEYEDDAAIKAAYESAKSTIAAVEPDSLSYIRADLLARMKAYYQSLNEENYSTETWATVTAAYEEYLDGESGYSDKEELRAFYDTQLAVIKGAKASSQEISYLDFPQNMNDNNFGWIAGDVVDVKLYTGNVADGLKEFDVWDSAANKLYNSELYAEDPTCFVQTWKWYVGVGKGVIVAYRANQDCSVTVTDRRIADGGSSNGWTEACVLNVYIVRNGVAKLIKQVNAPSTDADFSGTYYLQQGDILYVEFTTTYANSARNTESPYRTTAYADATGFNADLYAEQNHDLPAEVTAEIEAKTEALREYVNTLKESDYSATNWLLLSDYIDQFVKKCETEVSTVEDVVALYESILAEMKAVPDIAQAAQELQAALEGYVSELQAEYDSLVENNRYTDENKALLDKALADGIAAIRAAKTKAAGNTAKSSALAAMRAVEKTEKGAGLPAGAIAGIVIAAVVVVAAAVAATVVVIKKKKQTGK